MFFKFRSRLSRLFQPLSRQGSARNIRLAVVICGDPTCADVSVARMVNWLNLVTNGFVFRLYTDHQTPVFSDLANTRQIELRPYYPIRLAAQWSGETLLLRSETSAWHRLVLSLLGSDMLLIWKGDAGENSAWQAILTRAWLARAAEVKGTQV